MHFLISQAPLYFTLALTVCMLCVIWWDADRYIISNQLNGAILALFGLGLFLLPIPLIPALILASAVFAVGLGTFVLGLMGGGDVKLLAVLSLWAGWPATGTLLLMTALMGGVMALIIMPLRYVLPSLWLKLRPTVPLPRIFTRGEPIPYGIAIAGAFLTMLWTGSIPALSH